MAIPLKITITDTGFRKKLSGFGMRRVLRAVGMRFRDITQSNFGASGSHRASPWPPYKRNYPKYGKRKGDPATLIRTGHLRSSIVVDSSNDSFVEISSEGLPYADAHQFGNSRTPHRPYYPITGNGSNYRLTPFAQRELERVAENEISIILGQSLGQ